VPINPSIEKVAEDRYFSTHEVGGILGVTPFSIVKWVNSQSQTWNVTKDFTGDPSCATGGGDYNEGADYGWETYTTWDNCNSTTSCP